MRADPRINADDVTPSYGLFLTCTGEKYIQHYEEIYIDTIYIWNPLNAKNPLFGVVAISA
jgi:hypothetical protein